MLDDELPPDESPFGSVVSIDEADQLRDGEESEAKKTNLEDKLAGEDVPENYRGKSLRDIITLAETSREEMNGSLRAAKDAAEAAARAADLIRQPAAAAPAAPAAPVELTRDQIAEIFAEDPLKAIEIIESQAMSRIEAHVEARLAPLTAGTTGAAETWARKEFADEFELFEKEIKGMIASVPNKQMFSTQKGWEDAISYVRGQRGNIEKLIDHRTKKVNADQGAEARGRERDDAGFNGRGSASVRTPKGGESKTDVSLSADEREVAQRFISRGIFKDFAEYKRWQRM